MLLLFHRFKYTCSVECWDHVTRSFEREGYFMDLALFRHKVESWNGALGPAGTPYRYYETPEQFRENNLATIKVPLPALRGGWTGWQLHDWAMR